MIQLSLTPQQFETVCIALKLADNQTKQSNTTMVTEIFGNLYDEIALKTEDEIKKG